MDLFKDWLKQAQKVGISEPLGMTLTTVDKSGWARSRVVLLKKLKEHSIIFGSSSISDKGQDIDCNSKVAGSLWWRESIQQMNFRGFAMIASNSESEQLFAKRSREAKAVALCSKQSQPLQSESELQAKFSALTRSNQALERPHTWNAYEIFPIEYEFWQGEKTRLHKRLRYSLLGFELDLSPSNVRELIQAKSKWSQQRLQP